MLKLGDLVFFADSTIGWGPGLIIGVITHEYEAITYKEYKVKWESMKIPTFVAETFLNKVPESNDILKKML